MKKIFFTTIFKHLSVAQHFSRPLSKLMSLVFFMGVSVLYLQAQCPSPTATTPNVTTNNTSIGATTTAINSGSVTYVNGNVTLGTSSNAYTVTISAGTTWVISTGSHLTVTNLNVGGTLIIQAGASVSVVGLSGAGGSLGVNAGGIVQLCENAGIENCGTTTLTPSPSLSYVGSSGGKAVARFANKSPSLAGSLAMPFIAPATSSSSAITIATPPTSGVFTQTGSVGSALACTIGSNCTGLPYDVNGSCGSFANVCTAGTTAPTLTATTKSNTCPTTTVDLTTITATNLPSGTTLTWHTATPATTGNKVTGTAVAAGTYYAAFFDASGDCYSGTSGAATTAVTATSTTCTSTGGSVTNICPASTIDLNTHYQGTIPVGTTVTWHTGTPATLANKYGMPATAVAGTYYAAFEDATNNCYSSTMGPVVATVNSCVVVSNGVDTDNDGVADNVDLDDDNDGIPDIVECPFSTNTQNISGTGTKKSTTQWVVWNDPSLSNGVQNGDSQTITLADGTIVTIAISNVAITGDVFQIVTNDFSNLWPGNLSNTYDPSTAQDRLFTQGVQGNGQNGTSTTRLTFSATKNGNSVPVPAIVVGDAEQTGSPENVVITTNGSVFTLYEAYGNGGTSTGDNSPTVTYTETGGGGKLYSTQGATQIDVSILTTGFQAFALAFDLNTTALTCDTDNDGIVNHLDLDSDNDGCSDAFEAGATTSTVPDFKFSKASVGANGLSSSVENNDTPTATTTYTSTYSAATDANVKACQAVGTIDCGKTQIFTAPVFGQVGQKTLLVSINVTATGCFSPITVSGSGMSIANNIAQVCATTTGIQTFSIPVNYDGTTLGTTNFTIGAAGSCGADLTKTPKKAISDVWTLDCVPTVGPSMK